MGWSTSLWSGIRFLGTIPRIVFSAKEPQRGGIFLAQGGAKRNPGIIGNRKVVYGDIFAVDRSEGCAKMVTNTDLGECSMNKPAMKVSILGHTLLGN